MICTVLTEAQIKKIHESSVYLLEHLGMIIPHEEMLNRLEEVGARVNKKKQKAYFSEELVQRSLKQAGKKFVLYGRDMTRTANYSYGHRNFSSISGEGYWIDRPAGERRFASLGDVVTACRFGENLDGLTVVGAMSDPFEIPVEYRCVAVLAEMMRHTTKPVTHWFHNRATARYLVELMIALRGDKSTAEQHPLLAYSLEPISPLRFPFDGVDLLFEIDKLNIPIGAAPMAQMGATAPMSIAGTLVQQNAEILAAICVAQAVRPGTPILYCGTCHAIDMRTTQMIFGGPEQVIFGVALTQMGRYYDLPVSVNVGLTDSKRVDAQAGLEIGITMAAAAAAGASAFGLQGICGVDQAAFLDMLVLQNEIASYVESTMRELDFSDEALGLDVIEKVGHGGTFIDNEHTAERMRKELWMPRLLDREFFDTWKNAGAKSMEERCAERREQLLKAPPAPPLSTDMERTLNDIVNSAKKNLTA